MVSSVYSPGSLYLLILTEEKSKLASCIGEGYSVLYMYMRSQQTLKLTACLTVSVEFQLQAMQIKFWFLILWMIKESIRHLVDLCI